MIYFVFLLLFADFVGSVFRLAGTRSLLHRRVGSRNAYGIKSLYQRGL